MTRVSGKVAVKETLNGIGYIQQDPWLQQGKIQSNQKFNFLKSELILHFFIFILIRHGQRQYFIREKVPTRLV